MFLISSSGPKKFFFFFFFLLFLIGKIRHGIGKKVAIFDWEWGRNSAPRDGQKKPWIVLTIYMLVSSAGNGLQGTYTQIRHDIMWDHLDVMMLFPKQSLKDVILKKKKKADNKTREKLLYFNIGL